MHRHTPTHVDHMTHRRHVRVYTPTRAHEHSQAFTTVHTLPLLPTRHTLTCHTHTSQCTHSAHAHCHRSHSLWRNLEMWDPQIPHRKETGGSERLRNWPEVYQQVRGRGRTQARVCGPMSQSPALCRTGSSPRKTGQLPPPRPWPAPSLCPRASGPGFLGKEPGREGRSGGRGWEGGGGWEGRSCKKNGGCPYQMELSGLGAGRG